MVVFLCAGAPVVACACRGLPVACAAPVRVWRAGGGLVACASRSEPVVFWWFGVPVACCAGSFFINYLRPGRKCRFFAVVLYSSNLQN